MKRNNCALAAAVLGFGLVLSGCGGGQTAESTATPADPAPAAESGAAQSPADDETATEPTNGTDTGAADSADNIASATAAIALAEGENNGIAVEIDRSDDDQQWEVEVVEGDREVEYDISADGSEIVGNRDEDDSDDDDRSAAEAAEVSLSEAVEKAAEAHPGTLESAELDDEDDRLGYEVEIHSDGEKELWVDAKSGEVSEED
ncbi:hypothetical protein GCM10022261_20350 [Brevibacterium daeguense]|uniref:PepSY domain-containing protein n=1 Tax=Brevibacterium daeguense TaxID=909936 RepID=A0ABP8EKN5_9MICO|nr:PepSY domain-containing protein [Brevibacterium daeguense]